jgi:hypothetical protein
MRQFLQRITAFGSKYYRQAAQWTAQQVYTLRHETWRKFVIAANVWAHRKARRIFTRRIFVIVLCALAVRVIIGHFHIYLFGRAGDLFTTAVVEHVFFGVPVLEE